MSIPKEPKPVKFLLSLLYSDKEKLEKCIEQLKEREGALDYISPEFQFTHSRYYCDEMGEPLFRKIVSFAKLRSPSYLVDLKLYTNSLESLFSEADARRVNIDPGYIGFGQLILATGKPSAHRVYLASGIYADLHLIYEKGSFRALAWTYPDYASMELIEIFNHIRSIYKEQLIKEAENA